MAEEEYQPSAEERWNILESAARTLEPKLTASSNGSMVMAGVSMGYASMQKLYEVTILFDILRELYPDFTFWKSETLFDSEGMKINWKYTPNMSHSDAINSIREEKFQESRAIEAEQERLEIEEGNG